MIDSHAVDPDYAAKVALQPRLSEADERRIVAHLRRRDEAERLYEAKKIDKRRWARAQREGDDAEDLLVRSHLRLVVSIVRRYRRRGVELDDLVSEGNRALVEAARLFPERGRGRFGAYAMGRVQAAVRLAADLSGYPVRIPQRVAVQIRQVKRVASETTASNGTAAAAMAETLGISQDRLAWLERLSLPYASLNEPVGDGTLTLSDLLYYRDQDTEIEVEATALVTELAQLLADLAPHRRTDVVELLFGLDDDEPRSFQQVATQLGVTPGEVKRSLLSVASALRHPASGDTGWDLYRTAGRILRSWTIEDIAVGTDD